MPKYSSRAAKALGFLKRHVNDIEIYVEDTSNRNMWVRLISSLVRPGVRLRSINMLGGRKAVTDACSADQADDGRRKLFIVDGDFDHLRGTPKPRLKFLYRLRAYCVENILASEAAVVNIALETDHMITEQAARQRFDFREFETMISNKLKSLFELYAVANNLQPSLSTVGYSVNTLCTRSPRGELMLDDRLLAIRYRSLTKQLLRNASKQDIKSDLEKVRGISAAVSAMRSVSGKSYIFPILESRIRIRLGFKGTVEQLKVRLAGHFDASSEPYFARRVAGL